MKVNIYDKGASIMQSAPQELLKQYVQSQHFTSTNDIRKQFFYCSFNISYSIIKFCFTKFILTIKRNFIYYSSINIIFTNKR